MSEEWFDGLNNNYVTIEGQKPIMLPNIWGEIMRNKNKVDQNQSH